MCVLSLFQQMTSKNNQNIVAEDLGDQCNGINIKQKMTAKIKQTSIDIFYNKQV